MYKAVFVDMDGTLLKKDHSISEANKNAIQRLLDNGILVIPISARPLHGILPITQKVLPDSIPVVSLNGSYIFHKDEIISQIDINLQEVAIVHEQLILHELSLMYYSQMHWYSTQLTPAIEKEQRITDIAIQILPFEKILSIWKEGNTGPNKILVAGDKDLILEVEQGLIDKFSGKLNVFKSQPRYLELMHIEASKTKAIQFLMNQYGILQQEVIAIGDNYNDKEMIEFAGVGIAMGNAPEEIKMVADFVTDTNNDDGVAKALAHYFPEN
jgi:Cof subfamily protein (haloacid dehalogenase superfamily)